MSKNERLLLAIGEADEKYIKEAQSKMNPISLIKAAAVFAVIIGLSLFMFLPYAPVKSDVSAYESSPYFPLIEGIDNYRISFMQPKYKNNFHSLAAGIAGLFTLGKGGAMAPAPEGDNNMGAAPEMEATGNGSYVESTDNQVNGVIEGDLMKMTDKYIFRLTSAKLIVYSIDKENSESVAIFEIPTFANEEGIHGREMYLSQDCNTVTVLKQFYDYNARRYNVGLISIDVSDVNNISLRGMILVDGELNTSRMVGGRLLLITNYTFNRNSVDYGDPTTFVPSIDSGNGPEPIQFEDIIYPDKVDGTDYSVVALVDTENLSLIGANALLNFTDEVYVSAENIYISREYVSKTEEGDTLSSSNTSDIVVLGYTGETLEEKGIITLRGWTEDQYSFDELDGYLRVVTSTRDTVQTTNGNNVSMSPTKQSASLYVVDLSDNSVKYKVEDFAPQGEEATAVRFDGDECYVCTAVVVTFTDPVFFFDLSDYENITYTDTGIIEGYSDHLINYGDGLALGIGREGWQYCKVDVYTREGGTVESIHEYKFIGEYSLDYKAYLVNREENIFGFGVDYFHVYDEQNGYSRSYQRYVLLKFSEENMTVYTFDVIGLRADEVRAVFIDGYLYITTEFDLHVYKID